MKVTKVILVVLFVISIAFKEGQSQTDNSESYDCESHDHKTLDVVNVDNGTRLTFNCHNCSCNNSLCWEVNGVHIDNINMNKHPHYYNISLTQLNGWCHKMLTMTVASNSDTFPFYRLVYCTTNQISNPREKICTRNVTANIILIVVEDESPEPSTTECNPTSNSNIPYESSTGMASTTTTTLIASILSTSMSTTSSKAPTVYPLKNATIPSLSAGAHNDVLLLSVIGVLIAVIILLIIGMISVCVYNHKRKKNEQNDNGVRNVGFRYYEENRQNPAELQEVPQPPPVHHESRSLPAE